MPVDSNPLAILTFIAAQAVLTNATSLLVSGTSTRFARNVDRARVLIKQLQAVPSGGEPPPEVILNRKLLAWIDVRLRMLMRAMSMFYLAIGCFSAASMVTLIGAVIGEQTHALIFEATVALGLFVGIAGLGALFIAGSLLVRESRLALRTVHEEMAFHLDLDAINGRSEKPVARAARISV